MSSVLTFLGDSEGVIERLFVSKKYSEVGVYKVRLIKNGQWNVVTLDDYVPAKEEGELLFTKGR